MVKTNPLIRIALGFSVFLLFDNCFRYVDGNMDKFYLRLGIAVIILLGLYLKEFKIKKIRVGDKIIDGKKQQFSFQRKNNTRRSPAGHWGGEARSFAI